MEYINTKELDALAIDFEKFERVLFDELMPKAALAYGGEVRALARRGVPVDLGALRLSIRPDIIQRGSRIIVEVGPTQPYGADIEFGRPPGTVVTAAQLSGWAKRKGLNPYAVAAGIRAKGTKAQPFMGPALEASEGLQDRYLDSAILEAIKVSFKTN